MIESREGWDRPQDLGARASDLSDSERDRFLDTECREDSELRAKLVSMLSAADDDARLSDRTIGPTTLHAMSAEDDPGTIGPYRLGDIIGEGGMGVVYLAEQTEPFRRRVALKIVRPGHDHASLLARFDNERQALALMEHPAIAQVYDAGTTSDGRPYFAMEYVSGLPITTYCDRGRLSTRERLELFAEVCDGVQHAHQKGVIHRDLKPSNILVYADGARHRVKIIDFGIAKATGFRLTEKTLFTHHGEMIGTPEYMSPEQADPTALGIDTRTDVYSLGVLLYVLLVGEHPHSRHLTGSRDIFDVRRVILEEDAPRPSTRLDPATKATREVVESRRTEAGALRRELRGELDWIVLRALEKDRNRRYAAASEFAADVMRYLNDEPVVARPPSVAYTLRKAARRHRHVIIPIALFVSALLIALVVTTYRYVYVSAIAEHAAQSRRVDSLESEAASLWPEAPVVRAGLQSWLDGARALVLDLPTLRAEREELRSKGSSREVDREAGDRDLVLRLRLADLRRERSGLSVDSALSATLSARREELSREIAAIEASVGTTTVWLFDNEQEQHYHEVISGLIRRLESLEKVRIPDVEHRLAISSEIEAQSVTGALPKEAWSKAIAEIAMDPRFGGLQLEPQLGLVPLRRNPKSGFWEFWHVRTGERAEEGRVGRESGLVFVLVPGSTLSVGAERPRFNFVPNETPPLLADFSTKSSLAARMGLAPGDRLLAIDDVALSTVESALAEMNGWRYGQSTSLTIEREGGQQGVEASIPINVDPYATLYEAPIHVETVEPFFISKFEMTQAQWLRFTGRNPSNYAAGADRKGFNVELSHPVENVSWYEAQIVLGRLGLRLPTEAEWEYAARGNTSTIWWTGNDPPSIDGAGNLYDRTAKRISNLAGPCVTELDDGFAYHSPVGTYRENPFGLHDVIGNVWEWTATAAIEYTQPMLAKDNPYGIARGGGFTSPNVSMARSANRIVVTKTARNLDWGVRPARSIDR